MRNPSSSSTFQNVMFQVLSELWSLAPRSCSRSHLKRQGDFPKFFRSYALKVFPLSFSLIVCKSGEPVSQISTSPPNDWGPPVAPPASLVSCAPWRQWLAALSYSDQLSLLYAQKDIHFPLSYLIIRNLQVNLLSRWFVFRSFPKPRRI